MKIGTLRLESREIHRAIHKYVAEKYGVTVRESTLYKDYAMAVYAKVNYELKEKE
jgi:hypothetical protein